MKTNLKIFAGYLALVFSAVAAENTPDQLLVAQKKLNQNDYFGAVRVLDQTITQNPNLAEAYFLRATTKEKQRDAISALVDYSEAIRLNVADLRYYTARGDLLMALDRYQEAIDDYSHAIALRPVDFVGCQKRGSAHGRLQQRAEALE